MIFGLILVPLLAGAASFIIRKDSERRTLLVGTALFHLALTAVCWVLPRGILTQKWFYVDAVSLLFLTITSVLFCSASVYAIGYLRREGKGNIKSFKEEFIFQNAPEAVFIGCLLFFLSTMTTVLLSRHVGLVWIAMEATTLASAPLIYFHRHHRSLEATWKYLLICSVGIALALLGNLFLALAGAHHSLQSVSLFMNDLVSQSAALHSQWLKAAFLLLFVGYGTKMGLAPFHTWLPDAHSEAPSVVSGLLSGALLNCAFVSILRVYQICVHAGLTRFCNDVFLFFGILSLIFAALFIVGQRDYKRMLAYSSIEHMGILAIGIGLGGSAVFGTMLHAFNHSFSKALLFFTAGNILAVFKTKSVHAVTGVSRVLPVSGALWIAGFFAITGTPPFGTFISEFIILKTALAQGRVAVVSVYLIALTFIFIGMGRIMLGMAMGRDDTAGLQIRKESFVSIIPPLVLGILVLLLGVYLPPFLNGVLDQAQQILIGAR